MRKLLERKEIKKYPFCDSKMKVKKGWIKVVFLDLGEKLLEFDKSIFLQKIFSESNACFPSFHKF